MVVFAYKRYYLSAIEQTCQNEVNSRLFPQTYEFESDIAKRGTHSGNPYIAVHSESRREYI